MKLTNEVRIARQPADVFGMLLDVPRVASCMPGSKLTGKLDEDTYSGEVVVKVGPLGVSYTGTVRYLDVRRDEHTLVLKASGKERGGQGNADAHVIARVRPDGDGATVSIETDLLVRGKVAQFGRGVIGEVSQRLIGQFADNVERELAASSTGAPPQPEHAEAAEALDGVGLVARPLLARLVPVAAAFAAGVLLGRLLRGRAAGAHGSRST
ncbi:MAG: carbon monoxide dehydrogenase [Pseudonocardiaceae bacterium]|nr:carbon monoxide dehydrogenase [Pseudonocardiaceae bacterium]